MPRHLLALLVLARWLRALGTGRTDARARAVRSEDVWLPAAVAVRVRPPQLLARARPWAPAASDHGVPEDPPGVTLASPAGVSTVATLDTEVAEVAHLLRSLAVDKQERPANATSATPLHDERIQPTGTASDLCLDRVQRSVKRILANNAEFESRLTDVAQISLRALAAGRARSAQLAYDLGARRLALWTAKGRRVVSLDLVRAGLLTAAARRDLAGYEEVLRWAQVKQRVDLASEPALLSDAMAACSEAGWRTQAQAINFTLRAAGTVPSTAAVNAVMAERLAAGDDNTAFDVYLQMKMSGPEPDSGSQAFAARAAVLRKQSWTALRNLLRRPWLRIPWNGATASAAIAALLRSGNLEAAAGAAVQCKASRTPVRSPALEALLWYASVTLASTEGSATALAALEDHLAELEECSGFPAPPVSVTARLLMLPRLNPEQRVPYCGRGLAELQNPADAVWMQAALALVFAAQGRAAESAAWLATLHAEGVDLLGLDSSSITLEQRARNGALGRLVDALAPEDDANSLLASYRDEGLPVVRGESVLRKDPGGADDRKAPRSLWALALQACGDSVERAEKIIGAMEMSGDLEPAAGQGISALEELVRVAKRAGDPAAALVALRRFDNKTTLEAYVSTVETICTEVSPNMALATTLLEEIQGAGVLALAAPGQLLRLYVGLVTAFGRTGNLDAAYEAFGEGCERLRQMQQLEVKLQGEEARDEAAGNVPAWEAAERTLVRVMVEVAAPHPRGLLLACTLLEELTRRTGQSLKHGYYEQFINKHADANDLRVATAALQQAQRRGVASSQWRVSDSTIATLMQALADKGPLAAGDGDPRDRAIARLSSAGLGMSREVTEYLTPGGKRSLRAMRFANANDEIVRAERGGVPAGEILGNAEPGIQVAGFQDAEEQPLSAEEQYEEFERLLEIRERPPADGELPPKDTKRAVDVRHLKNMPRQ